MKKMKTEIAIFLFIIFISSGLVGLGGDKLISLKLPFSSANNVSVTPTLTQTPTPTGAASPTPTATLVPGANTPTPSSTPIPRANTPTPTAIPNLIPTLAKLRPNDVSSSKLGIFIIGSTSGINEILRAGPKVVKVLDPHLHSDRMEAIRQYKRMYPNGRVVMRVFVDESVKYNLSDNAVVRADNYWNSYLKPAINQLSPSDRQLITYISGPNENDNFSFYAYQSTTSLTWINIFLARLADNIGADGRLKPLLGEIPVGNLEPSNVHLLLDAFTSLKNTGGAWSYHAFTLQYSQDPSVENWYSLRYRQFYEQYLIPNGLGDLKMILTETGIDQSGDPNTSGWKVRGSETDYKNWLTWFDGQIKNDDNIIGSTIFEIGDPSGWPSFDIEPIANWLRDYLAP